MKKALLITITLAALILITGCESDDKDTRDTILDNTTPETIAAAVLEGINARESIVSQNMDLLVISFLGIDTDSIKEFSYYVCASGFRPDELLIIKFKTSTDANVAKSAVQGRLDSQKEIFRDYASPEEMLKFEDAVIQVNSNWLFFYITENNAKVKEIINSYL